MLNGRLGKDFVIYNQPLIWVWNRTRIKGLGNLRSIH